MIKLFKNKESQTRKLTKCASIYISDKYKHIIINPNHENNAGIIYEQDKGDVSDFPIDTKVLGQMLIDNLNKYSIKDVNLRDHKRTDWPAFKQGKSKSVTTFEKEYIQIFVSSANDSNLILTLSGSPFVSSELTVNSTISFHSDQGEIGQRVLDIYQACLTGKLF